MISFILFKPSFKIKNISIDTFWIITLIGALLILITKQVNLNTLLTSLTTGTMNPIKILILFISLSMISISLDELNFFSYISAKALKIAGNNQYKIFFILYFLISILTIFTSNDIVILTFTPFIINFSKKGKINPIPYLVMEFVNANTYSMMLSIGNPTNIYLASGFNITFGSYLAKMILPTIIAGITSLILIILIFRKQLNKTIENDLNVENEDLKNKMLVIINLIILFLTTILLVLSNYINIAMWLICLLSAILLSIILITFSIIKKDKSMTLNTFKRLPYTLIPFIISMFILVLSLKENGYISSIQKILDKTSTNSFTTAITYLLSSVLFDNLINNIPMSVLFTKVLENRSEIALFSTIIGSNIGAYLTPVGALAGIMWMSILKKHNISYSFKDFIKYGLIIVPFVSIASAIGLLITI
jgi:arsenical pump membrane protein